MGSDLFLTLCLRPRDSFRLCQMATARHVKSLHR